MEKSDNSQTGPQISVVVPFYNEEANVEELYRRLKKVLDKLKRTYELIFIDDGSTDKTPEILQKIYEKDELVKIIRLRKNFGQTAALQAGFDFAQGEIIISMDGDLQHDPEDIPLFLAKMNEGYDVVSGWRKKRVDNLFLRRIPSLVANRIMKWLSGVEIHDFGTTFKAYKKEVIKKVHLYGELHRFIPALTSRTGVKITEIPIKNVVRQRGKSKYGLSRVRRVFFDLITVKFIISFIDRPLQFFGLIGVIFGSIGFAIAATLTIGFYFFGWSIRENLGNLILSVFLMMMGLQLVMTGLLAEILSRVYFATHKVKIYSVEKILSREKPPAEFWN
ncbi:MAG: glycosyltransferase [Candidatus Aminicenantes bacterium]|nr:MAG: glycosyltransferase [Candidatus Aminicenantes bacterium]